jgi:hypothetical protein
MTLNQFLEGLETSNIGTAIRGESGHEWLFPNLETLHVLALAVVFGSIIMVDLRLLGVVERGSKVSKIAGEMLPYTWVAFACAVVTGGLMFMSKATTYFHNLDFRLKFLCMLAAGINMLIFHWGAYRRVKNWDLEIPAPAAARVAGGVSIACWVGVVFFGRFIGFTS